jgi:hypothetical protein
MNHTGNELRMMLDGIKPLSMFYDNAEPEDGVSLIPEATFDPYVESKQFVKGTKIYELAFDPRTGRHYKVKYVLYALKGEEWRIPATFLVLDTSIRMPKHEESIDRLTGALLGYSNAEIDEYVAKGNYTADRQHGT